MAENLLFIALISLFALGLIVLIVNKSKSGSRADTPYIRGESIVYDEVLGLCYVKGVQRKSGGRYNYRLETELEGITTKDYSSHDLLEPNKHLNIVGRSFIITTKAVSLLSKNVDVVGLTNNFEQLKNDYAELQSKYRDLEANMNTRVDESVEKVKALVSSLPRPRAGAR